MMGRMRAMARGIGWLVVLLLAVAAIGCAGLWVRSYDRSDLVRYCAEDGAWELSVSTSTNQLVFELASARDERPLTDVRGWRREMNEKPEPAGDWRRDMATVPAIRHSGGAAGVDWFIADGRPDGDFIFPRVRAVGIPLWFVTLVAGVVPFLAARTTIRGRRARRRREKGLCERCGYDLRASAERCPECGTVIGG